MQLFQLFGKINMMSGCCGDEDGSLLWSWERRDLGRGMEQRAPAALADLPACPWHLNAPCPGIRNPFPPCKCKMSSCDCQGYDYVKCQPPFSDLRALCAKEPASILHTHLSGFLVQVDAASMEKAR